jgi:hypothetical protein
MLRITLFGNTHWHAKMFVKNSNLLKAKEVATMLKEINDVRYVKYS